MGRAFDRLAAPLMASTQRFPSLTSIGMSAVFTFVPSPLPTTPLSFPAPPTRAPHLTTTPQKRTRALTDVDGEYSCVEKKKRRLRLFLITSRLSRPFSAPATNIVDRGSSKIAVWAKQKALGRNLLRKAAILNRIRRNAIRTHTEGRGISCVLDQEKEQKQLELARLAFLYGSHDTHTRPVFQRPPDFPPAQAVRSGNYWALSGSPNVAGRPLSSASASTSPDPNTRDIATTAGHEIESVLREDDATDDDTRYSSPNEMYTHQHQLPVPQLPRHDYLPLPPSPLGLSNYDAFDLEDEIHDPYSAFDDDDDDDDGSVSIFNQRPQSPAYRPHADETMHDTSPFNFGSPNTAVSYVTDSTLSSVHTPPPLQQQPRMVYSDFSLLDPDEAVVGDYDGLDGVDGVRAVWPHVSSGEVVKPTHLPTARPPESNWR
ncbi:uncharacterized protein BDZ99DRAFT_523943 [Mytilinidion resinicola]|uniref:Uncharacterized protein n=1 Tax=Mytilinidion resinicola TaxID=574789 RepID=A0A6A6YCG3_9PEZI|nr:uncharacterized protein BDZ99DRAFT_523943 [Mytilinidion resinicola]KAF2806502.1 hypothetical protein BDZ99DRAFT_523943 [Mytilinidion resinicola]